MICEQVVLIAELHAHDWKIVKEKGIRKMNNNDNDRCNIQRFLDAQKGIYELALQEIKNGEKRSHWMWFIFPQLKSLGRSEMSEYYGISGKEEAIEYFNNPILKNRYLECCHTLLTLKIDNPFEIFEFVDSLKLQSSLTLFYLSTSEKVILDVLNKFFDGRFCEKTVEMIEETYLSRLRKQ